MILVLVVVRRARTRRKPTRGHKGNQSTMSKLKFRRPLNCQNRRLSCRKLLRSQKRLQSKNRKQGNKKMIKREIKREAAILTWVSTLSSLQRMPTKRMTLTILISTESTNKKKIRKMNLISTSTVLQLVRISKTYSRQNRRAT